MVNKSMTIQQVLQTDAGLADLRMASGMHCLGCVMASGESLEQACAVHGIDVDALIERLNEFLTKKA